MTEEAGVVAVGVVQLLPQLLGVHIKVDADRALLRGGGRGLLEVGAGVIDHVYLGLVTGTQELFLFPLPLVRRILWRVGADGDLQGARVTRLRHLEQLLGNLVRALVILSQLKINVKPENIDKDRILVVLFLKSTYFLR